MARFPLPKYRLSSIHSVRVAIALAITLVLWASAFAGIREGLRAYTPGHLALLRFLVASGTLLVYAFVTRMRLPAVRDLPAILLLGFMGITVYQVALSFGERSVPAGVASILVATVPCFTAILAVIFLRERIRLLGWVGVAVSFVGVVIVVLGEGTGLTFATDALLILLASVAESVYFVVQKPYLKRYTGLELATYTILAATLFMLIYTPGLPQQIQRASITATLSVVYLGIFPAAIAYLAWSYVLARMTASIGSSFLYVIPIFAVLLAWPLLNEIPSLLSLIGGAVVIVGVALVNVKKG